VRDRISPGRENRRKRHCSRLNPQNGIGKPDLLDCLLLQKKLLLLAETAFRTYKCDDVATAKSRLCQKRCVGRQASDNEAGVLEVAPKIGKDRCRRGGTAQKSNQNAQAPSGKNRKF